MVELVRPEAYSLKNKIVITSLKNEEKEKAQVS